MSAVVVQVMLEACLHAREQLHVADSVSVDEHALLVYVDAWQTLDANESNEETARIRVNLQKCGALRHIFGELLIVRLHLEAGAA